MTQRQSNHDEGPFAGLDARTIEAIVSVAETASAGGDDSAFESALRSLASDRERALARAVRADRGSLRALEHGCAPAGLFASAMDAATLSDGAIDPLDVAALEAGAVPSIDGPPVSRVTVYREPVLARLVRRRREFGMMAAALLVFASGLAIVAGVRAVGALLDRPAGVVEAERTDGDGFGTPAIATDTPDDDDTGPLTSGAGQGDVVASAVGEPEPAASWLASVPLAAEVERVASVFEAAPVLETGRLVVYARSGSAERTGSLMAALAEQVVGLDHSFGVRGVLEMDGLSEAGLPERRQPVIAMAGDDDDDDAVRPIVLAERSAWLADVRPSPAALAAVRKRLEEAGFTVEFRVFANPVDASGVEASPRGGADDATGMRRTSPLPIVIDSLPGR
jgi:hypothetical protein